MIPQEYSAAVTRGLREAFGVTGFDDISTITKGQTTSLVFRIVVRKSPFLLKIFIRRDSTVENQFACLRAAGEAGLGPRVWYTSMEDRISITDFVDAVPFPVAEALVRMPVALRALHALPPFPERANHLNTTCMFLINQGPALDGFIQRFQAANILPAADCEKLFAWRAQLAAAYQRHEADMVSSHNDLFKPDNVVFDGNRVWLVDWEAAFLNDRYADLAVFANLVVTNDAEEKVYLQAYFGQPPDEYQLARFFLMQQLAHMFYAVVFLQIGSSGEPVDLTEKAPDFTDFHRRIWAGEVHLADKPMKIAYGKVHWERLVHNMGQPRLNEALRIVAEQHACA